MFGVLARKLFGTANDRILRDFHATVSHINHLEAEWEQLSDDALKAKTAEFRTRLEQGETVDSILAEAFATVREASKRTLGLRHFDVQLIGGMVLHKGMISEMKTGEGKTLVSTLPAYLNALSGKGVHIVTVNDYLARRDADWMGEIYAFLGLSVGCIQHNQSDLERKEVYAADITYGTNNEFGFDYLRDNMKYDLAEMVQRPFHYAIVDEVDSILIDEARTPLIISGPTEDTSDLYIQANKIIPELDAAHFDIDEKSKTVTLSDDGTEYVEQLLKEHGMIPEESNLYDIDNISVVHHVNQSLRAHHLFQRDVDYIVHNHKVVIIDEFTGRMMEGRRYSDGLHQALEAKEDVPIQNENQTLASITFQNYFRLYPKLAGMTGTAMTEAAEFEDIYRLRVLEIPTHRDIQRIDHDDEIYRTVVEKYDAIVELINDCHKRKQPVLVGTVSIERSEILSGVLKKHKIPHEVLNARHHEREAQIIAQAGRAGAVTIATNMAGRGTDIMLGGNPDMRIAEETAKLRDEAAISKKAETIRAEVDKEKAQVLEAGGLYIIGTERHESRRIDNQLRGRSGRQGDPGASKFFLSLEDDLMRIFGSERMDGVLQKLGLQEGEAIYHPWMSKALEKAQKKVEGRNYEIRKNLLKYDDVMNDQRKVVYEQRRDILDSESLQEVVSGMLDEVVEDMIVQAIPPKSYPEQWDTESLTQEAKRIIGVDVPVKDWAAEEGIADDDLRERLHQHAETILKDKEARYTPEVMRTAEKRVVLHALDYLWKEHLHALDHLRQGITLRAYGQRDPLNEYKHEAFSLFERMLSELRETVISRLMHMEIRIEGQPMDMPRAFNPERMRASHGDDPSLAPNPMLAGEMGGVGEPQVSATVVPLRSHVKPEDRDPADPETWGKVGRNEACPCGSGKKYKHCHGMLD